MWSLCECDVHCQVQKCEFFDSLPPLRVPGRMTELIVATLPYCTLIVDPALQPESFQLGGAMEALQPQTAL